MTPLPADVQDRILRNVSPHGSCWQWQGARRSTGYGVIGWRINGRAYTQQAHRVAFAAWCGPIPEGAQLHHTCRNKWCVNPFHMEAVSRQAHSVRHAAERTHCKSGRHPWTRENQIHNGQCGALICRLCRNERMKEYSRVRR